MDYYNHRECIDACLNCAVACNHCASSCLQEEHVQRMARCIQLDMECAAVCYTAAQLMSLGSEKAKAFCLFCAEMCDRCAEECAKHDHAHCQECAQACRACAEWCRKM